MEMLFVPGTPKLALSAAGRGDVVLFLHGIGGFRRHWDGQLEALAPLYRAVAWDARGYGESEDAEGPRRFADFTGDVLRTLDFLGAARAHLVGLSMGGRIARNFALEHPARVRTLTLANTSPGFDALPPEEVKRFVEERRKMNPERLPGLLAAGARPEALEALKASFAALRPASYLRTLEASVSQDRAAPLEALAMPTLVITGEDDKVYPAGLAREMARRIPGAELAALERCGHMSNLEQPERFNAVLLDFLRRHA